MIAQIRSRIAVESVEPALVLAFEWAGDDDGRKEMNTLCAFVELIRALDQYQREANDA